MKNLNCKFELISIKIFAKIPLGPGPFVLTGGIPEGSHSWSVSHERPNVGIPKIM